MPPWGGFFFGLKCRVQLSTSIHPKKSDIAYYGLYLLAFVMGTGFLKLEVGLLVLAWAVFWKPYVKQGVVQLKNPWLWIGFALLGVFLWCYWFNYVPYKPQVYSLEAHYFKIVFAWTLLACLLPLLANSTRALVSVLWFVALGAFVFAIVTIGASMWLLPPPWYGSLVDLRGLVRGTLTVINSPGISNLLCFAPLVYGAALLLDRNDRPRGLGWLGPIVYVCAVLAAVQIQQRSPFVVLLILEPLMIGGMMILLGRYRTGLALLGTLMVYPLALYWDKIAGLGLLKRKADAGLLTDARFQMVDYWITQLLKTPWARIEVGPPPYDGLLWFHNFFADVHRLSGLLALVSVAVFFLFVFARLGALMRVQRQWGAFLLVVALPTFLIINTSVVPEGEKQPFLMLVLVYSVCECLISNWKRSKLANGSL